MIRLLVCAAVVFLVQYGWRGYRRARRTMVALDAVGRPGSLVVNVGGPLLHLAAHLEAVVHVGRQQLEVWRVDATDDRFAYGDRWLVVRAHASGHASDLIAAETTKRDAVSFAVAVLEAERDQAELRRRA